MCLLVCVFFFSPLVGLARPNLSGPVLKACFVSLHRTRSHYKRKPSWLWALSGAGLTISLPLEMWTSTQGENMTLICLAPASSLWLLPWSPGHPAWWSLQPGSHARGFGSKQQSRNDHSSWLAEKMAKPAWACGLAVMQFVVLGGGGEYLDEMASIRRISTDICAYLPFGHDWTKTSTQGKEDFLREAASAWFWCRCVDSVSFHVS